MKGSLMIDTDTVRIVDLAPMRVACARGFGTNPESEAWERLTDWARGAGIDSWDGEHRFFGHNDPSPSGPGEAYGYRQCVTIGDDVVIASDLVTEDTIGGGRWAVIRCQGLTDIGARWKRLATWVRESHHAYRHTNELEELLSADPETPDDYLFDLYLPIE